jgi:hypothetical protein
LKPTAVNSMDPAGITKPQHPGGPARFLTDVIVDLGLVDRERVAHAVEEGRRSGKMPEEVLLDQGALTADGLSRAVAERHGLDHLDLTIFKPDMSAANLISIPAAKRYEAVPVDYLDDRTLLVAMADPANVLAVDDIALLTGKEIRPAVTSREDILNLISRLTQLDDVPRAQAVEVDERVAMAGAVGREGDVPPLTGQRRLRVVAGTVGEDALRDALGGDPGPRGTEAWNAHCHQCLPDPDRARDGNGVPAAHHGLVRHLGAQPLLRPRGLVVLEDELSDENAGERQPEDRQ